MAYYATVIDGDRKGFLVGPFNRLGDAERAVPKARKAAYDVDDRAHWYAFGTARVKTSDLVKRIGSGRLNGVLGYPTDGTRIREAP